jgi:chromate transporter
VPSNRQPRHLALEVLTTFLRLGCTSFGGPIAHLGYFQRELIDRRHWTSPDAYAEVVALAQTLPGPASSQVGFALGLLRAGWLGGLAAFTAFTLPSAVLMLALALGSAHLTSPLALAILHALQLVAVAVVAQAILAMQRTLAPDIPRLALAAATTALVLLLPTPYTTLLAVLLGAAIGILFLHPKPLTPNAPVLTLPRHTTLLSATAFTLLLAVSLFGLHNSAPTPLAVFSAFYRTGALVFGGGHVVLPLLETAVVAPHWVSQPTFLSGYGAAQALPGPLFSFAAYLGAATQTVAGPATQTTATSATQAAVSAAHPIAFALIALFGIFAPGLLAMAAILPLWTSLRQLPHLRSALTGVNAAVVGLLLAALIRPLATSTLRHPADFLFAAAALLALTRFKAPSWTIVLAAVLLALLIHIL